MLRRHNLAIDWIQMYFGYLRNRGIEIESVARYICMTEGQRKILYKLHTWWLFGEVYEKFDRRSLADEFQISRGTLNSYISVINRGLRSLCEEKYGLSVRAMSEKV